MLFAEDKVISACLIDSYFFFVSVFETELGSCSSIYKYDIKNNILKKTKVSKPDSCANRFIKADENYIEYYGTVGDEEITNKYHARFYFNEDRIENIK